MTKKGVEDEEGENDNSEEKDLPRMGVLQFLGALKKQVEKAKKNPN